MMTRGSGPLLVVPLLAAAACVPAGAPAARAPAESAVVIANDNRVPGGRLRGGVLELRLEARPAAWQANPDVDSTVSVQAFAEVGGPPRIPGPLLRTAQGTEVRVSVRNAIPDSTLVVYGLRAGTQGDDTLHVGPGAVREVRYIATRPGTFLYWGRTTQSSIDDRPWRDSQLTGAIVIDPHGATADMAERIFVITILDLFPEDTVRNREGHDIFDRAINGLSWPHTERLQYDVGESVRWRWLNGSYVPHPMHLHGFHFRVLARGDGQSDTTYAAASAQDVVTEFMVPGSTFRMEWVPTREGTWLMHCHMIPHIVPFPARTDSASHHDLHDVEAHPLRGMSGLVVGITTVAREPGAAAEPPRAVRHLRLLAQQARDPATRSVRRGYVLQQGDDPAADSVVIPGVPLVLTRGETTAVTVVNRLDEPTTVHWHGMELESLYDGVAGWSRTRGSIAPLLAPGDSFTVTMTPPRAGTFIYHTHMEEGAQLPNGMYGPLLVMEPGERFDPMTDLLFVIGGAVSDSLSLPALNGRHVPAPLELRAGTTYRLRFINILTAAPAGFELRAGGATLEWQPIAKDGADLPSSQRGEATASVRHMGVGETYDFQWTPTQVLDAELVIRVGARELRQRVRVRP